MFYQRTLVKRTTYINYSAAQYQGNDVFVFVPSQASSSTVLYPMDLLLTLHWNHSYSTASWCAKAGVGRTYYFYPFAQPQPLGQINLFSLSTCACASFRSHSHPHRLAPWYHQRKESEFQPPTLDQYFCSESCMICLEDYLSVPDK